MTSATPEPVDRPDPGDPGDPEGAGPWGPGAWAATVGGVVLGWVVGVVGGVATYVGQSGLCRTAPDPGAITTGRLLLVVLVAVLALPWVLAVRRSSRPRRTALFGALSLLPALAFLAQSLTWSPETFRTCLFTF